MVRENVSTSVFNRDSQTQICFTDGLDPFKPENPLAMDLTDLVVEAVSRMSFWP